MADQQGRGSSALQVVFVKLPKIDVGEDVHVVHQEGLVAHQERRCLFDAAARVEQVVPLVGDVDRQAEIVVGFQIVDNLLAEMVDVDDDLIESGLF